jgi:hypothetical protein
VEDVSTEATDYRAYLLRLWRENDKCKPVWRASLRDVKSGKQIGFTDLEALFAHLRKLVGVEMGNCCQSKSNAGEKSCV